jgi:hypothetical protein
VPIIAFFPPRRPSRPRSAHTFVSRLADAARSVVAEFRHPATPVMTTVDEPADVYAADELPPVADIEAAAALYFRAADQARTADRAKRAARKLLDRLPAGRHGAWDITREPSGRETVDLEQVRRLFKEHGLGPVPMKSSAPSLKVRKVIETSTVVMTVQPTVHPMDGAPTSTDPHRLCVRRSCDGCGIEADECDLRQDLDRDEWECEGCADSPSDAAEYRRYTYAGA